MISQITWLETSCLDPYQNLALEKELALSRSKGQCTLFLWQNQRTVVIGRNQNPLKECRMALLEQEKGHLARRLSGGGAVFHDLGNLNFSFLVRQEDYNIPRQIQVILKALELLGIKGNQTGRNDLAVDGRKFSGSAFYQKGAFCCHHGTLLVDTDKELMARYLTVSREKLSSKGVSSVPSRVVNLKDLCPQLTIDKLKGALVQAFSLVYGLPVQTEPVHLLSQEHLDVWTRQLRSRQWIYGQKLSFDYEFGRRFSWGDIQIQIQSKDGTADQAALWSDGMDQDFILQAAEAIKGCSCQASSLCQALDQTLCPDTKERREMLEDIKQLIKESF